MAVSNVYGSIVEDEEDVDDDEFLFGVEAVGVAVAVVVVASRIRHVPRSTDNMSITILPTLPSFNASTKEYHSSAVHCCRPLMLPLTSFTKIEPKV